MFISFYFIAGKDIKKEEIIIGGRKKIRGKLLFLGKYSTLRRNNSPVIFVHL